MTDCLLIFAAIAAMTALTWWASHSGKIPGASWISRTQFPRGFKVILVLDLLIILIAFIGGIACALGGPY